VPTSFDCDSFHARACSLPPLPMTRIFIRFSLPEFFYLSLYILSVELLNSKS
jgi:hypothetical protein